MSTPPIRLLEAASADLRAAFEHYRVVANPRIAATFLNRVEGSLALIQGNPQIGRPVSTPERKLRLLVIKQFPFSVIYRAGEEGIVVIAIAHHRRRPGYWTGRG